MLQIRELTRSFREGERVHRVLDGASANIAAGEIVAVIGRSGSGKSTLLHLIAGIDQPDAGSVLIGDCEITTAREPARTLYRRRHIGLVHQFFNLIPTLDVQQNVRIVLELNGVRGDEAQRRTQMVLGEVGLGERLKSFPDVLSGGEQQRVAIARALVHEPRLLLADEPTGNLDEATAAQILPLLLSMSRTRGATLLIVTHDLALTGLADRTLELHDGGLVEQ